MLNSTPSGLRYWKGFTLIELLVVIAVIAVLAGITLAAMGGVQKKAARDRTTAEISSLVNAMESYRSQFGAYPPADNTSYQGNVPYLLLTNYLETFRGQITDDMIIDPFGNPYVYQKPGTNNRASFDLYSTAGDTNAAARIGNW